MEHLKDDDGSVVLAWLQPGTLYARLTNVISGELGARFARRLRTFIGETSGVSFFIDLSAITSFDVDAYSAVTEVLSHKRDQLRRVVAYTWPAPLGPQARALPARLSNLDYVTSEAEFDDRLAQVDPRGLDKIETLQRSLASLAHAVTGAPVCAPAAPTGGLHPLVTYVFDLSDFEKGSFVAFRMSRLTVRPRGTWVCRATSDADALEHARRAALEEWARPASRLPERFTVTFRDAPLRDTFDRRH